MIEFSEHFYDDDPTDGHPDVRTRLADVSYFFLGNGRIQAAVQVVPAGEGTPLGLLVMDPDRLLKKREAAGFDPVRGLAGTLVRVETDEGEWRPRAGHVTATWDEWDGVPAVRASWQAGSFEVRETFFCPDRGTPRLARHVAVRDRSGRDTHASIRTNVKDSLAEVRLTIPASGEAVAGFLYVLDAQGATVRVEATCVTPDAEARGYWNTTSRVSFGDALLDRVFRASLVQLPALVSSRGRMDGSLWQYTREWVRDQALNAVSLAMAGHCAIARTILQRLLAEFVTAEGATIDSGETRGHDEVELDQNGVLVYALHEYLRWTGDRALIEANWERIAAVMDYPLRPEFRHAPSGLLWNTREYWERHRAHGIEPGFELPYQVFVAIGLDSGAALARTLGKMKDGERWSAASLHLRDAVLHHPAFALVDERGFVKRRRLDGSVQDRILARPEADLPSAVPLASEGEHLLRPDTCEVLPIVYGFAPPDSEVAARTLRHVEGLWNQAWRTGGYGRYHVSSEPDSPGAWPFPSVFVARAAVETGDLARAWRVLRWLDTVPGAAACSWFEFYGERVSPPFPQVGIIPWTWAELIALFIRQILGVRLEDNSIRVRPRLLPGVEHVEAAIPIRGGRLMLELRTGAGRGPLRLEADQATPGATPDEIVVPYRDGDMRITSS
jgi:hypothetical protein